MNAEPKKAYVYQPMPPQADGRFYGVGGLEYTPDSPRAVYKKFKREFLKRQRNQS